MKTKQHTKKVGHKILSLFTALLLVLGVFLPGTTVAQADGSTLAVARYTSTEGSVSGTAGSNQGTYQGTWKASIPMGKVLAGIESTMKSAADNGLYPHGKDGAHTIAYVEYRVTFPADVTIDEANISTANATTMFNTAAFSHAVSGQTVTFKFPLCQENWAGIYAKYNNDGGASSDKTIDINIPYSVSANSQAEAQAVEAESISAAGEFETHASATVYDMTGMIYSTDTSTKPVASDFSTSNVFSQQDPSQPGPNPSTFQQDMDLEADLRLGDNTGNQPITVPKEQSMDFVGVLNVAAIKTQMDDIKANYPTLKPEDIGLENLKTGFTATLTLPAGLSFADPKQGVLSGANGIFAIESTSVVGQTATVNFKLVNADQIKTFDELYKAIHKVDDELKVTFQTAKFDANAQSSKNYEVTGSVSGSLTADATHTPSAPAAAPQMLRTDGASPAPSGTKIAFALTWNGKQSQNGASASNPDAIALSVNYGASNPKDIYQEGPLDGDLLINNDTQHDRVIELEKTDLFTVTGVLNVAPIKKQLQDVKKWYQGATASGDIAISDMSTEFTASIELPNELMFSTDPRVKAQLDGANGKFKISKAVLNSEGNKLTVTMTVAGETPTFADIEDAVNGVADNLKVSVPDVAFKNDAQEGQNYTIKGEVSGRFHATATKKATGTTMNFTYQWNGVQLAGGEDCTTQGEKTITATVKYGSAQDFVKEGNLDGDLLVNGNTQHDKVYVAGKNDSLTLTGLLDVSPIKKRLKELEDQYTADDVPTNITVDQVATSFKATMTLPEELKFAEDYTVELTGANGKFKITNQWVSGKTITVIMSVADNIKTFKEVKEAVDGADKQLKVNVKGVQFVADQAKADTNYTIFGTVSGEFKARATNKLSGKKMNFRYTWNGIQLKGGEDSTDPTTTTIKLTLKYVESQPENSTTTTTTQSSTPKTGDTTNIVLYATILLLAVAGVAVVAIKRKKYSNK